MIVAHIMGIPIEESVMQLVPAGAAIVTAVAIAGRTSFGQLRRWATQRGNRGAPPASPATRRFTR